MTVPTCVTVCINQNMCVWLCRWCAGGHQCDSMLQTLRVPGSGNRPPDKVQIKTEFCPESYSWCQSGKSRMFNTRANVCTKTARQLFSLLKGPYSNFFANVSVVYYNQKQAVFMVYLFCTDWWENRTFLPKSGLWTVHGHIGLTLTLSYESYKRHKLKKMLTGERHIFSSVDQTPRPKKKKQKKSKKVKPYITVVLPDNFVKCWNQWALFFQRRSIAGDGRLWKCLQHTHNG